VDPAAAGAAASSSCVRRRLAWRLLLETGEKNCCCCVDERGMTASSRTRQRSEEWRSRAMKEIHNQSIDDQDPKKNRDRGMNE
jgi:hypothetical protein